MAHVFSMPQFRLGSHGLRLDVDGKGGNAEVMRIGHARDAFHLVWWMTNFMHFSFVLVLLAYAKISLEPCSSVR
jgi:hypothetical protein